MVLTKSEHCDNRSLLVVPMCGGDSVRGVKSVSDRKQTFVAVRCTVYAVKRRDGSNRMRSEPCVRKL